MQINIESTINEFQLTDGSVNRKCAFENCNKVDCKVPWHNPCDYEPKHGLVKKLRPMVVVIGGLEVAVGIISLLIMAVCSKEFDRLYATEDSKLASMSTFACLAVLAVSGAILLTSVLLERKRMLWFYILTATFLCVCIFVLSVLMIHFSLLLVEKETRRLARGRRFLLSTACEIGVLTLLGSVIHFIGNVIVFTYYSLKYLYPNMIHCDP